MYDIVVVGLIALVILAIGSRDAVADRSDPRYATASRLRLNGAAQFRLFISVYLIWRFATEFLKPTWKPYLGLSAIQ